MLNLVHCSGLFKKLLLVGFVGLLAWAYQATRPPPPKICGTPDGPPITAPRIKLSDGRHLAYKEHGVPREEAKYKFVYIHGIASCRNHAVVANLLSPVNESFCLFFFDDLLLKSVVISNSLFSILPGNSKKYGNIYCGNRPTWVW